VFILKIVVGEIAQFWGSPIDIFELSSGESDSRSLTAGLAFVLSGLQVEPAPGATGFGMTAIGCGGI
jgi:hypothetical protein